MIDAAGAGADAGGDAGPDAGPDAGDGADVGSVDDDPPPLHAATPAIRKPMAISRAWDEVFGTEGMLLRIDEVV
ncbi:MAG: hypothetical protein KF788_21415 [Piscinibacter sp.]|nr:hypothetical protein [Piscinibacter sp.]